MKIFKYLFYSLALIMGLTIAFCSNSGYDPDYTSEVTNVPESASAETSAPLIRSEAYLGGKKLFKANCAACHNKNMIDDLTGPALKGTLDRWEGREEKLYDWIRNSSKVIASGDAYAVAIYNRYNKSVMTAFPNLSDEEIEYLLEYIDEGGS